MVGGYAAAFREPGIIAACTAGPHRAIAVAMLFWSGGWPSMGPAAGRPEVAVPWLRVDGPEAAAALADAIEAAPRLPQPGATAIGDGMAAGLALLARCPAPATRLGDGCLRRRPAQPGPRARPGADIGVAAGVTINGLAVLNEEPDLLEHYLEEVIGGPGSFAMDCPGDIAAFAEAIRRKLLREDRRPSPFGGGWAIPLRRLKVPVHVVAIPGPVQTRPETRAAMAQDIAPWDNDFRPTYATIRERVRAIAGGIEGVHATLPLQGCGHFIMEAAIRTFVPAGGKLLIAQNGSYADRALRLATEAGRQVVALPGPDTRPVTAGEIAAALAADPAITHVAIVHHETGSGIVNDPAAIGPVVRAAGPG